MILDFDAYQEKATETAIYADKYKIVYPAMGLPAETGELLNKLKKIFRDQDGEITNADTLTLKDELGDVLWYLAILARDLEISLADIATSNIAKLESRKARGKLKGSGDDR